MTHNAKIDIEEVRARFLVPGGRTDRPPGTNGNGRDGEGLVHGNGRLEMTNRLRMLRSGYSWSQAELARRLGVSRQTVNALERGKYHPSLPLAFKIARLFERPIEDVFHPQWESERPDPSGIGHDGI